MCIRDSGNATIAPYSEQFYVGGANSIRAFTVRSIGPGGYHPKDSKYSYLDQDVYKRQHLTSGDMKLNLSARSGVNPLISQSTHFMDVLMKQIDEKALNHAEDVYKRQVQD